MAKMVSPVLCMCIYLRSPQPIFAAIWYSSKQNTLPIRSSLSTKSTKLKTQVAQSKWQKGSEHKIKVAKLSQFS